MGLKYKKSKSKKSKKKGIKYRSIKTKKSEAQQFEDNMNRYGTAYRLDQIPYIPM